MEGKNILRAAVFRPWLVFIVGLVWTLPSYAQLVDIRTGHTAESSRFVLDLSSPAEFRVFSLKSPARVVVRLKGVGRYLPFTRQMLKDPRVKRIRAGRNKRDLIVVFDLKGNKRFKFFSLGRKGKHVAQRVVVDIVEPVPVARSKSTKPAHKLAVTYKPRRPASSRKSPVRIATAHKPARSKVASAPSRPTTMPVKKVSVKKSVRVMKKPVVHVARTSKPAKVAHKSATSTAAVSRKGSARLTAEQKQLREEILKYTRRPLDDRKLIVAIDAGHGGKDTGAIGVGGLKEKDVTLALARELKREIDRLPNMRAVLVRDGDYFVPLNERPRIAKEKNADLFISLHADAFPDDRRVRGGSIYVLNERGATTALNRALERSENGSLFMHAQRSPKKVAYILGDLTRKANLQASRGMANAILKQLARKVRMHKLSVQSANFAVLRQLDMPSILVETAFISNRHDAANLRSRSFRKRFATALAKGVQQYAMTRANQPHWGESLFVKYKVRSGDTLSEIAQRFGTDVRTLKRLNHIRRADRLYAGMRLRVPLRDKVVAALN